MKMLLSTVQKYTVSGMERIFHILIPQGAAPLQHNKEQIRRKVFDG